MPVLGIGGSQSGGQMAGETMMLVAENDDLTLWDLEIEAFNQLKTTKKELVVLPDITHMSLYSERSKLEIAAEQTTPWLRANLVEYGQLPQASAPA